MLSPHSTYLFNRPSWHYSRPRLIEDAINKCRSINKNYRFLKKIGSTSPKQVDALKSFSQALLHYIDLGTLKYGIWDRSKNIFINFDLKILKKATNISSYYFNRCVTLLKKAGYLDVERAYKTIPTSHIEKCSPEYNKSFKALPANRTLNLSFFIDLGFSRERIESVKQSAHVKQMDKVRIASSDNKPRSHPPIHSWVNEDKTKKDEKGKEHIASIKEILNKLLNQESGP